MKKKILAPVLSLMTAVLLLAGCSQSTVTPSASTSGSTATSGTSSKSAGEFAFGLTGTFKIMVAGEQAADSIDPVTGGKIVGWNTMAAEFETQNPGCNLEFVEVPWADYIAKLQTAAQSGEFDVLHLAAGQNAACGDKGYVLALNDYITKDKSFDGKALYGNALWTSSAILTDGKYFGLPKLGYTFTHLFNKKIFDDFGVKYLTNDSTWDDILAAAKACTGVNPRTKVKTYGIFARGTSVTAFYELVQSRAQNTDFYAKWDVTNGFTGDISKIQFTIKDNAAILSGLDYFKEMNKYATPGWVSSQGSDNFFNGDKADVAIWLDTDGGGVPKSLFDAKKYDILANYVFIQVPAYKDAAKNGAISRSSGNFHTWGIPASAKKPDASWQIVKFLSSKNVSKLAYDQKWLTPVFPDAISWINEKDPYSIPCIKGLADTYNYPFITKTSAYAAFNSRMIDLYSNYVTGVYTREACVEKLAKIQTDMEAWRDNAVKNKTR